ncbi:hypothetical protein QQF64_012369 [Cirrhinus molitorella]|uniref:Uncharacterized protein n=1 Tax=Cirrhinus molitorella TaxID=172907 RepID=A0ABR3LYK0_9TELE
MTCPKDLWHLGLRERTSLTESQRSYQYAVFISALLLTNDLSYEKFSSSSKYCQRISTISALNCALGGGQRLRSPFSREALS